MPYELTIAWRTISHEGIRALLSKCVQYVRQIGKACRFLVLSKPRRGNAEEAVEYCWSAAGGLICPGQVRSEILELARRVEALKPKIVVEIGTATGGTLFLWASLMDPMGNAISIDLPGGKHGGGYPYWKTLLYRSFGQKSGAVRLLRGSSHDASMHQKVETILHGRPIDFLFIDGDHTYAGVAKDYEMYAPLVRAGGLIAFHDICRSTFDVDSHVDEFWREIRLHSNSEEFIENIEQGWAGIGVIVK